jgi:hypothetical protein
VTPGPPATAVLGQKESIVTGCFGAAVNRFWPHTGYGSVPLSERPDLSR